MQRLEVSCAVRSIYGSLGAKGLIFELYVVFLDTCLYRETGLIVVIPKSFVAHNTPSVLGCLSFSHHTILWTLFLEFFFLLHFCSPQEASLPYCHC
jgi:hypothetical protein